jgi:hypothetical protein
MAEPLKLISPLIKAADTVVLASKSTIALDSVVINFFIIIFPLIIFKN